MKENLERFTRDPLGQSRHFAQRAADTLRDGARQAANYLNSSKQPARRVVRTGLKLNSIAHKSIERLVRHQLSALEGTVNDGARRLKVAADSRGFRGLVNDQIALFPATRERIGEDLRKTGAILLETRNDIGGLVRDAVADFQPGRKAARRRPAAARRAAAKKKPAAKKAATRKKARVSAAARKTAAKPATRKRPAAAQTRASSAGKSPTA